MKINKNINNILAYTIKKSKVKSVWLVVPILWLICFLFTHKCKS